MHDTGNTGSELNLLIHLRPETENKTGTLSGMCVPMTITHGVGFPCWLVTMTRCIMLVTPGLGHIIIVSGQRGLDRAILQLPSVTPHRGREDIRLIFVLCTGYPRKSTMLCVFTFLWDSITFTFAVSLLCCLEGLWLQSCKWWKIWLDLSTCTKIHVWRPLKNRFSIYFWTKCTRPLLILIAAASHWIRLMEVMRVL